MKPNKKTTYTPGATIVPVTTVGKASLTKSSPHFDTRSTISNTLYQDPTHILVAVPRKTPIPDAIKNPVDPTEAFKRLPPTSLNPFRF